MTNLQCSDVRCHWTHFHTPDAYYFDDAEKLIMHLHAHERGTPIPDGILNAPLRVYIPLASDEPGSTPCRGNCKYKGGGKPRASQPCIEIKCRSCCIEAAADARKVGLRRAPCQVHKVDAIQGQEAGSGSAVALSVEAGTQLPDVAQSTSAVIPTSPVRTVPGLFPPAAISTDSTPDPTSTTERVAGTLLAVSNLTATPGLLQS